MIIEKINKSFIYYDPTASKYKIVEAYYQYVVNTIKKILIDLDYTINVLIGDYDFGVYNKFKKIRIDFQIEHTLVKFGGRSVNQIIYGETKYLDSDQKYLIRISDYDRLMKNADIILEYSQPNITNISSNPFFNNYLQKIVYFAPSVYEIDFSGTRQKSLMTSFINTNEPRRAKIISNLINKRVDFSNISCYDYEGVKKLLKTYKVLLNVHQTEHHHTLEEFRILPAILNGMIVVSERVPLFDKIPYKESIILSEYEEIINVCQKVLDNYHDYFSRIFTPNLYSILDRMKVKNYENLYAKILELCM